MPIAYPYRFSDWYGYDKDCSSRSSAYRYDGNPGRPSGHENNSWWDGVGQAESVKKS